MLAVFETGVMLEVIDCKSEYNYTIYDKQGKMIARNCVEKMYEKLPMNMNPVDYVLVYCEPVELPSGCKYKLTGCDTLDEYIK